MSKKTIAAASLVVLMIAAGCQKSEQPAAPDHDAAVPQANPVGSTTTAPAEAPVTAPLTAPVAGVAFSVDPMQFRKCESNKGHIVATLKWDVTAAGIKYVNVLVGSGTKAPTLFMTGKASGERKTGDWVMDGTQLILQDAATKHTLATVVVTARDC